MIYYSDQNNINGVAYDPAAPPMSYAQIGTAEEWTIQNNTSQAHMFHVHQVHFVVEAIDGVTQAQQAVMDDVNVPATTTTSGAGFSKGAARLPNPVIIETFLVHCHILSHEDGGMMANIRIAAAKMQLSTSNVYLYEPSAAAQNVAITGGRAPYAVSGCAGVANASVNGSSVSLSPVVAVIAC